MTTHLTHRCGCTHTHTHITNTNATLLHHITKKIHYYHKRPPARPEPPMRPTPAPSLPKTIRYLLGGGRWRGDEGEGENQKTTGRAEWNGGPHGLNLGSREDFGTANIR